MDSLSAGIPSAPSIAMADWTGMNTDLRDDFLLRMPSQRVAGIRSVGWPPSSRNGGRHQIGRVAAFKSEYMAALRRDSHEVARTIPSRRGRRRWNVDRDG